MTKSLSDAINKTKHLVSNLSYYRKKSELEKIFTSPNYKNGVKVTGLITEIEKLVINKRLGIERPVQLSNYEESELKKKFKFLDKFNE